MVEDVVVGLEDTVRKPVVAYELPKILDRVQFGRLGRQRHQRNVVGDEELRRHVPACLIKQDDGVGARRDVAGDLGEMTCHSVGVAAGHDECRARAPLRADRSEQVGRGSALVSGSRGSRSPFCPAAGDRVLLAYPHFVLEPDFYGLAGGLARRDLCQRSEEIFLKASSSNSFCA